MKKDDKKIIQKWSREAEGDREQETEKARYKWSQNVVTLPHSQPADVLLHAVCKHSYLQGELHLQAMLTLTCCSTCLQVMNVISSSLVLRSKWECV